MLERGEPLSSDQFQSPLDRAASESGTRGQRSDAGASVILQRLLFRVHRTLVRSRVVVGLALVAAGLVWAVARGLTFYGVSPVHLAYDLDQPPWLLVLVSGWLWYRSRRE
jgi:hypothetical protein